jgi:hypothetical protein
MNLTDFIATVTRIAIAIGGENAYQSGVILRNIQKAMKAEGIRIADADFARLIREWEIATWGDEEHRPNFMGATGTKGGTHFQHIDARGWPHNYSGIRLR